MTKFQFAILSGLSGLCLVMAVELARISSEIDHLQRQITGKRAMIEGGVISQLGDQKMESILVDLRNKAATNQQLRQLLSTYGYKLDNSHTPSQEFHQDSIFPNK
jgi:hypothetical protein